jgi:hypothetical protein
VYQAAQQGLFVSAHAASTTGTINVTTSGNDFEVNTANATSGEGLFLVENSGTICAHISGNSKLIGHTGSAGIETDALG